jgi:hypothetical protein
MRLAGVRTGTRLAASDGRVGSAAQAATREPEATQGDVREVVL